MLLSSALPLLPPPSTSLLPPLNPSADDPSIRGHGSHHSNPHGTQHQAQSRRQKPTANPRGTLALLSTDERQLAQRKVAIAMYGYSWLKPAGCSKTMLGRREEELEREEVERQLREVEMQERMAAEADEMDRQAERQAEGDAAGLGDRDLDDEVPDADMTAGEETGQWGEEYSEGEVDQDGEMRDLDDDIPSAEEDQSDVFSDASQPNRQPQSSPQHDSWTYDSRREPSTPSSAGDRHNDSDAHAALNRIRAQARLQRQAGYQRRPGAPGSDYDVNERDAEALALADEMLDEDEMGNASFSTRNRRGHDYDGSDGDMDGERDLDDSVPEADDQDEGEWEHTDSDEDLPLSSEAHIANRASPEEDEDEEMDISILPPHNQQPHPRRSEGHQMPRAIYRGSPSNNAIDQRHTPRRGAAGRVVSGNAAITSSSAMTRSQQQQQQQHRREGSAGSFASGTTTGLTGRSGNPSSTSRIPSTSGAIGSRRGLRSQTQHVQQFSSGNFETPQPTGYDGTTGSFAAAAGSGIPRTGTLLLGTDSTFGMGMSTAGTFGADTTTIDSIRQPHGMQQLQQEAPARGTTQEQDGAQRAAAVATTARRGWLNPSAARRNLFGLSRGGPGTTVVGGAAGTANGNGTSSGGLFTPEGLPSHSLPVPVPFPGRGGAGGGAGVDESPEQSPEPDGTGTDGGSPSGGSQSPGRQRRSGRLLAGFARRAGRGQQQQQQ